MTRALELGALSPNCPSGIRLEDLPIRNSARAPGSILKNHRPRFSERSGLATQRGEKGHAVASDLEKGTKAGRDVIGIRKSGGVMVTTPRDRVMHQVLSTQQRLLPNRRVIQNRHPVRSGIRTDESGAVDALPRDPRSRQSAS